MRRQRRNGHPEVMTELAALSTQIASVVARAGNAVVAVHARPRFSSSGVLWKPGVIVTAEHTIRREDEITVTLPNGNTVPATLAGSDPRTDIAVLKVDSDPASPPIATAAPPQPGELAFTIGRSKDSGVNATMGIISAVSGSWRTWRGGRLDHYVRLDLTVYPGSSGGLVMNVAGEAIGIASTALSRIAGLAIPAVTVDRILDEILAHGHLPRPYLGVGLQAVETGLIVMSVGETTPGAKAGILVGDILVSLDGVKVSDTDDIQSIVESRQIGQAVEAVVSRGGETRTLQITLGERPRRN
jgi:S1-C subfamily serine protease